MNEIFEGKGLIESKEEGVTKKGDKFWKFKIDGKTYSIFEYEAGKEANVGMSVKMSWTETEGTGTRGPITYRNLKSIYEEKAEVEAVESPKEAGGASSTVRAEKVTIEGGLKEIAIELKKLVERLEKLK